MSVALFQILALVSTLSYTVSDIRSITQHLELTVFQYFMDKLDDLFHVEENLFGEAFRNFMCEYNG